MKATIGYRLVNSYIEAATKSAVSPNEIEAIAEAQRLNLARPRWGDTADKVPLFDIPLQEDLFESQMPTRRERRVQRNSNDTRVQAGSASVRKVPPATESSGPVSAQGGAPDAGIDVTMPQMGESIFEGTVTKWLKKPGEKVLRDEPLFEITTDKVDAEIPAPSSGVLRPMYCCAHAFTQNDPAAPWNIR